jgi:hypothetical protein
MEFGSTSLGNLNYNQNKYLDTSYDMPIVQEKKEIIKYFKNNKHTFKAILKKQNYGYTIKIGGHEYLDCINITINLTDNNVTNAVISHIQSEPECGFGTYLEDGDMVNFLKATLQFCQHEFPSLKSIEYDDMSNIDCGKSISVGPPRRLERPFSLAHFSIARTGKTWYENRFGAKMINKEDYIKYRNSIEKLYKKIDIPYLMFESISRVDEHHTVILEKYFSQDKTWIEFFNSIPKSLQCKALYNWLPSFIKYMINNTYNPFGWYIDIDTMEKTTFQLVDTPSGGSRSNQTRRRGRKTALRFSNQWW